MKYFILILFTMFAFKAPAANVVQQWSLSPSPYGQFLYVSTASSAKVLPVNLNRGYLFIQNIGTAYITVNFGAADTGAGIQIYPQSSLELGQLSTNSVWIKGSITAQSVVILEGNTQ